jgi:hypothetical protein
MVLAKYLFPDYYTLNKSIMKYSVDIVIDQPLERMLELFESNGLFNALSF